MKITCLLFALVTGIAPAIAQVTITGFGTGDFNYDAGSSNVNSTSQSGTSFTASMSDAGGQVAGFFATPVSIVGNTSSLSLTATVTTNPGSSFTLELYDGSRFQTYQGNWSSFTPGVSSTATINFGPPTAAFNYANISGMILSTGGSPGNTLGVTLDQLVANPSPIPEPSTYAAVFGVTCLGVVFYRRRLRAAI